MTKLGKILGVAAGGCCLVTPVLAVGFIDTFDSIDSAWVTDRYAPSGFESVFFDKDNRLKITISETDNLQNRPSGYQSLFYNTQGKQRAASLDTPWMVSGDLFISEDMLNGANLRRTDLWARDSATTEAAAMYPIIGMVRNDATDPYDATANLTTRWRVYDGFTANGWIDLDTEVTGGWHNLSILSTGTQFQFKIDGTVVSTLPTDHYSAAGFAALQTVFVQAYNFSDGTQSNGNYSVYWDNIKAQAVPEPFTMLLGAGALALALKRRLRKRS